MPDWKATATQKRESVLALIPKEWRIPPPPPAESQRDVTGNYIQQYLTPKEIEITESTATSIVQKATTGAWTALEIAQAFCHRAAVAHQLTNCLHEIFFEQAYASARQLDAHLQAHGQPVGPLHGLPVSLKDQFHVRDVETHMGYVGWIGTFQGVRGTGKERTFESEMVRELRALGAVLYVKTSVPHTLMCGETVNNIVGYTTNPRNRHLSSGGSSGGEGALIALHGSPLGFGTDIGGSIRIPAAFNGLYGLRPSTGRLPYEGMANSWDGAPGVLSVVGPLAPNVEALKLATQSLLSKSPWLHDPLVHEIPWRSEQEETIMQLARTKKLCFGVLRSDGTCSLQPPVKRALEEVVKTVERLGHKVVDWTPPAGLHAKLLDIINKCWSFDGSKHAFDTFALSGESPAPQVLVSSAEQYDATQIAEVMVQKRDACKEYMEYWNATVGETGTDRPVDAVISPVAPFAAARPAGNTYYGYTTWVNLLDYTSVVVPVTTVDKNIDTADPAFQPLSDTDQKTHDLCEFANILQYLHSANADNLIDDAEIYDGAHVSIQLVGRRLQEEKMLALASYVSNALHSP